MRGKLFLTQFLCGLLLVSCDFGQEFGEKASLESSDVKLKVNVSVDDAITQTSGGLNAASTELKMRISGTFYESDSDFVSLTSVGSETSAISFEGIVPEYGKKDNVYLYHSSDGKFSGTGYTKSVSSTQSGCVEDILDNVLYYSWLRWDAIAECRKDNAVEISTQMSPMAALLKFNVPEELQARNIRIKASVPIAGTITVNPQKGWGSVGENSLLHAEDMSDEIVIDSEENVSGDQYVVLIPNSFDLAENTYCNSTEIIRISCDYYEGELIKRYSLSDNILCGALTDLGQIPMPVPKIPVEPGTIRLMADATLTVGISDSNPDCEYYYEVGSTKETCATPSITSKQFDPEIGFIPTITGTFDKYYIKVLAHTEEDGYKDVVLEASLRSWSFKDGCEAGQILARATNGEILTQKGETVQTTDGLIIVRRQFKDNDPKILNFEQTSARIAYVSARVPLYMPVEHNSQATLWFCIDQTTCIGTGQRAFNLYYNDATSRVNELNGYTVKDVVKGSDYESAGRKAIVWTLGDLKAGDKVAPVGDGQHVFYSMALLEVL